MADGFKTRRSVLLLFVIMLGLAATSSAADYASPFGFTIDIPTDWIVLSPAEIKDNPDLFALNSDKLAGADPELLKLLKNEMASGQTEMYFHQGGTLGMISRINVSKSIGHLPKTKPELNHLCDELPKQFEVMLHKTVLFKTCESRDLPSGPAVYVDSTGVIDGTRLVQYQIQKSFSVILTITGTFSDPVFPVRTQEFDKMVRSIQFK